MPEGDTVFLACERLHDALAGRELTRGELRHPGLSARDLTGRTVLEVRPAGKHLLIRLDSAETLHSHLRMDGAWHLYGHGTRWRRPRHQVRAVLGTRERLAVGFCLHELALLPTRDEHRLVGHLGPDLLAPDWSESHVAEAVRGLAAEGQRSIGAALLDQTAVAGVGNIYRTEVCFLLGRSPHTPVREVDVDRAVRLCRELLSRNARRPERSTTGDSRRGARHWVYGRRNCLRCGTTIVRTEAGARSEERVTHHCPRCQP